MEREIEKIILEKFNKTGYLYNNESTLNQVFEEQVKKSPGKVAVRFDGREMTYQELNERSNQLAGFLIKQNVGPETIVALCVERSFEMIIGILAVLKAGGAYLPVNPDHPSNRIEYILSNSGAILLLTTERFKSNVTGFNKIILFSDEAIASESKENLDIFNKPSNLAYVIYTSGSTGNPKGAMIEHRSVLNRINWMQRSYPLIPGSVIMQKTPYDFDVSVWELFWWFFVGATVSFLKPDYHKSPDLIVQAIKEEKISVMHFVPSLLNVFLDYLEDYKDIEHLSSLEYIFSSGEALPADNVNKFNQLLYNNNKTRLINLYGPTEATVDVSYFDCYLNSKNNQIIDDSIFDKSETGEIKFRKIPIGRPIDNIKLYVLDDNLSLCDVGAEGELYISGIGVARGYLNNPELTSKSFIKDPFFENQKMYKTGDLARWMPDGNIEYLGRSDFQVKLRGLRIELGEIENVLMNSENIKQAVVLAKDIKNIGLTLCAYISINSEVDITKLKLTMKKDLPEYMIPTFFTIMEVLPLNSNGKVDRKLLPEPEVATGSFSGSEVEFDSNNLEGFVKGLWSQALGNENIGLNDNFFDLGGHSLLLAQIHAKLQKKIVDKNFTIIDMLTYPTVSSFVKFLNEIESKNRDSKAALKDRASRGRQALNRQKLMNLRKKNQ